MKALKNTITGLYFVKGVRFTGDFKHASLLTPDEIFQVLLIWEKDHTETVQLPPRPGDKVRVFDVKVADGIVVPKSGRYYFRTVRKGGTIKINGRVKNVEVYRGFRLLKVIASAN